MSKWRDNFSEQFQDTSTLKRLTEEMNASQNLSKILQEKQDQKRRQKIQEDIKKLMRSL